MYIERFIFHYTSDPPALKTIPDQRIKTGDTLSITCQVISSNPAPNEYKWSKVGDGTFGQTGQLLTIPNIQLRHAGTYRCTAVNTMVPTNGKRQQGSDTEDVKVDVQCTYTSLIVLRNEYLFSAFMGNELGWGTWQILWTAQRLSEDLSLPHPSSFPMNAEK